MKQRATRNVVFVTLLVIVCIMAQGTDVRGQGESTTSSTRIAVVVSKDNPIKSLTLGEIRLIFLRNKLEWPNGWPITVYERSSNNPIRTHFADLVLKRNLDQLKIYWLNLKMTRGIKAPKICRSSLLLTRFLERVKGGVGYMYEHEVDSSVKIVNLLEVRGK